MAADQPARGFIKWDGTISAGLIIGLGLMWSTYQWTVMQDLKDRMTVRETSATEYRKKVDGLETAQREVNTLRSDLLVLKEAVLNIKDTLSVMNRKLDGQR